MIDYSAFYALLEELQAEQWLAELPQQQLENLIPSSQGKFGVWQALITALHAYSPRSIDFNSDSVRIGQALDISPQQHTLLYDTLRQFCPWRKGPFSLFGIDINTEWHSDWKWQRLLPHISPLQHRLVLDVGCGNGYHCWRMLGAGAKAVIGIDPLLLNVMQFQLIKHLQGKNAPVHVLPLGMENLPQGLQLFDTVFSMGVLYHRRSPIDHLIELRDSLQPGGELVLETLIIDGSLGETLLPTDRYARMRNVWFIPSVPTLSNWMRRCGFKNIRLVDINQTSILEQRRTEWMTFHSLEQFLDPNDHNLTCEGLPAPKRAIVIANS